MNNETLFREEQRYKQWWLWVVLLGAAGIFLFIIFRQVNKIGSAVHNSPGVLWVAGIISVLVIVFFSMVKLETEVKKDGIYVKFFPFNLSWEKYSWDRLRKIYVRKYNPMTEYGGWGKRFGFFGKGNAYTISGNKGLQLELTDDKATLLIGTKKPEKLKEVLTALGQYRPEQLQR
jgi:hypothetical protein